MEDRGGRGKILSPVIVGEGREQYILYNTLTAGVYLNSGDS